MKQRKRKHRIWQQHWINRWRYCQHRPLREEERTSWEDYDIDGISFPAVYVNS